MEKIIFDAVATGNLLVLQGLLQEDPLLLERAVYSFHGRSLLHVAADHGHLDIVKDIVGRNAGLAELPDLQGSTPLHLASARGDLRVVEVLSSAAPDACFWRDNQGRNPVHVAALKGRLDVVRTLVKKSPIAARETTNRNETVLHLCVKYSQFEVLKYLVSELKDAVDDGDDEGNGILHLAVKYQQVEMIRYLVERTVIDKNMKNFKGKTPSDLPQSSEIRKIFDETTSLSSESKIWIHKSREIIMVVAVLISTMAFQAVITPPGGVWQDNKILDDPGRSPRRIGEPVMVSANPVLFKQFIINNIIAFFSSLAVIVLLISGLCSRWKIFRWVLILMMWLSVANIAGTFAICIKAMSPEWEKELIGANVVLGSFFWLGVLVTLFHLVNHRLMFAWLKNVGVVGVGTKSLPR